MKRFFQNTKHIYDKEHRTLNCLNLEIISTLNYHETVDVEVEAVLVDEDNDGVEGEGGGHSEEEDKSQDLKKIDPSFVIVGASFTQPFRCDIVRQKSN